MKTGDRGDRGDRGDNGARRLFGGLGSRIGVGVGASECLVGGRDYAENGTSVIVVPEPLIGLRCHTAVLCGKVPPECWRYVKLPPSL